MEKSIDQISQVIQKLILLHRQLLEKVRAEKQALIEAHVPHIEEIVSAKEALIEAIRHEEAKRLKLTGDLAIQWKYPLRGLTLSKIIIEVQGTDLKKAEDLRSAYNALTFLIQRIQEQNRSNALLVEASLEHVENMKKNILSEGSPNSSVYSAQGQSVSSTVSSKLLSKEV